MKSMNERARREQADALSLAGPASRELYEELLSRLKSLGPFKEEIKKTSIHLVRSSAFAGAEEIDAELMGWLREAYDLGA